jgi:DNA-binding FadR family transcriptional regulator
MSEPETANDFGARRVRSNRRTKTAMTVAQRIVEEISRKQHRPGTKLPAEREMLAKYAVGRGTLRESLRFLEMNGVLTVKPGPGGGPVVAEADAHDLAGTLGLFLELHRTSFGAILEVRETLEPAIARLAAERVSDEQIALIAASVEDMARDLNDVDQFLVENEHFHTLVAKAAGNPVFSMLMESLNLITDGTRIGIGFPIERRRHVLKAHRGILSAIEARDPDAAANAMGAHVHAFRRYSDKHFPNAVSQPLRWVDIAP